MGGAETEVGKVRSTKIGRNARIGGVSRINLQLDQNSEDGAFEDASAMKRTRIAQRIKTLATTTDHKSWTSTCEENCVMSICLNSFGNRAAQHF